MISAEDLQRRLAGVEPIGRGAGGTTRLAWTAEDAAARGWFTDQATGLGLSVRRDAAGNLWAEPPGRPPWWAVGSHLDTVVAGGAYDGALGVAAGFEVAARARAPVAVISFADEEGARFNTPTFGSRALVGALNFADALARVDDGGITMAAAMAADGVDSSRLVHATGGLSRMRGFLELHIDQGRQVAAAGVPVGVVSALAARMRLVVRCQGRAGHAGAASPGDRRNALEAAARAVVVAHDAAEGHRGVVVTAARVAVDPNALTTIPREVTVWIDARCPDEAELSAWHAALQEVLPDVAARTGVAVTADVAARSAPTVFDPGLRAALSSAAAALGSPAPEVVCMAGHDAGVVQRARPAAMVLVRNREGVSHAPDEHVDLADAAVAATILLNALDGLESEP